MVIVKCFDLGIPNYFMYSVIMELKVAHSIEIDLRLCISNFIVTFGLFWETKLRYCYNVN